MIAPLGAAPRQRAGVILLIVISLLVLFSLVGLAFVVYAQSQANVARLWRESETAQQPDMDPELLLAYFLGQLVYGTDNPHSALRGHSLAETMYGRPGNTLPFNGSGRLHTHADPNQDDYYRVDYTAYDGVPRDPHQFGGRNAPYTYSDFNSMFLAAVRGGDGAVLLPSYVRAHPAGGAPITLRPSAAYHPRFPTLADPSGDVKNLADSPGHAGGPNDSIWVDLGFPVLTGPDGRRFKPLFAPLVQDLDNRVNVNVHGNWACFPWLGGWDGASVVSHEGWGAWEVNPRHVLTSAGEVRQLFRGHDGVPGKYNGDAKLWGSTLQLHSSYAPRGPFYSQVDYNSLHEWANHRGDGYPVPIGPDSPVLRLPGVAGWTPTFAFPWFHWQFHNAGSQQTDEMYSHPRLYNFFDPEWSYFTNVGKQQLRDRSFAPAQMEALLRYGDSGSPALSSDLFRLCPRSLAEPRTRRLLTTHSFDLLRPGVAPYIWDAPNAPPYTLSGSYPQAPPLPAPTLTDAPQNSGEFGADWRSRAAGLGRIDLNRPLANYPDPNASFRITNIPGFTAAQSARQQLARELLAALCQVTGAGDPAAAALPAGQRDAQRWLAQLAVNIVDFTDTDNYSTPFNWSGSEWVFGTELPWLVLNEAYAELGLNSADPTRARDTCSVRFWIELHNPLDGRYSGSNAMYTNGIHPTALRDKAIARLQIPADGANPAYAAYQVVVADSLPRKPSNSPGELDTVKLVVANYDPDPQQQPPPTVDTTVVNPINAVYTPAPSPFPTTGNATSGADGGNSGYYLLGPRYVDGADEFPGKAADRPKPTLRVKEQDVDGQKSSLIYTLPRNNINLQNPPRHAIALRRLACPHLPPQTDASAIASRGYFNPYITVDYLEDVPTHSSLNDNNAAALNQADVNHGNVTGRSSVGRNQPYAAHQAQVVEQRPGTALIGQPQHTFFKINVQSIDPATGRERLVGGQPARSPYQWLRFADRPLVSPLELLVVSGYKPHELTQQFMGNKQNNLDPFAHCAPWDDGNARIHRLFEFLEAGTRMQLTPVGGRAPGRINLNTVWDVETFRALCDAQPANGFTAAEVDAIFAKLVRSRSPGPGGAPGGGDRPFQFGSGAVEDSLLRRDPDDPTRRLFDVHPKGEHPHMYTELLRKIANNVTTRSNVFGVWLTVGFFEVESTADPIRPPVLGAEIGWAANRHVRHRMFAIVDRSNLTTDASTPLSFFLEALTAVPGANQAATIQVHTLSGKYEGVPWQIGRGSRLVVDVGERQETVEVTAIDAANQRFTATFTRPHPVGFAISNAVLGNPGPQPRFDPRHPAFAPVVRYFSIIQ